MYIVVVTGAIGSGKSEAVRYLDKLGAAVVSLDEITHDILETDPDAQAELVDAFGEGILDEDGVIINRELAERAFADADSTRLLNSIMHPRVGARALHLVNSAKTPCIETTEAPALVVEVPLPEHGDELTEAADEVMCITADESTRYMRLLLRGLDARDIEQRMQAQMPQEGFIGLSDTVFENSGIPEDLHMKLDAWWAARTEERWRERGDA